MFRTALSILLLSLGLAACGFHPVYDTTSKNAANGGNIAEELASVSIQKIDGREGQIIQTSLEDLLNPGSIDANKAYLIKVTVKDQYRELGINTDLRITRYDVVPNAVYELVRLSDNKLVDSGNVRIKASYNRTTSEFATYVAEQNARDLADKEVAEELRSRLIYYFSK